MMVLGYAVLLVGALSISVSVMKLIDKLEQPRAKRKTPTMGEHRRGRVNF